MVQCNRTLLRGRDSYDTCLDCVQRCLCTTWSVLSVVTARHLHTWWERTDCTSSKACFSFSVADTLAIVTVG